MGDPRRIRRKFLRPGHPWQKERIEYEKQILYDYGLVNKTEIWKFNTKLKVFADEAKRLIAARGMQAEREKKQLLLRLANLGLVRADANLDNVLGLRLENLLDRRLQTLLVKKGLARTPKQARQFITHRHVKIGEHVVTSPSHLIRVDEETTISFAVRSTLANAAHPERASIKSTAPVQTEESTPVASPKTDSKNQKKHAPRAPKKHATSDEKIIAPAMNNEGKE